MVNMTTYRTDENGNRIVEKIEFHDVKTLKMVCPCCGKESTITVDFRAWQQWKFGGLLIQSAFPNLSAEERELIKTGFCLECQKKIFGE